MTPDQAGTTGTTPSGTFVGRVAGDDVGYESKTGGGLNADRAAEADDRCGGREHDPR